MIIVEAVPLELSDVERDARHEEIAAMLSDMQMAGLEPCVLAIETHSGGDSFVIEVDHDLGDLTTLS